MFVDVETFFLHTLVNANADGFIYNNEQNGCDNQSEHNAHARREIQHFFSTFHREFTELLEAENGNAA